MKKMWLLSGTAEAAVDAFADKDTEALTAVLCADASNPLDQVAPSPIVLVIG